MKILLVHNYYRSGAPGGEDIVFEQERDLLIEAGHEVHCYTRSNDEMDEHSIADRLRVVSGMQRSRRTVRELLKVLRRFRPDVAHFHNVFPLISASAYEVCHSERVPVVQTIHNFRLSCSTATHFKDGQVCELCTPGDPWAAVRHRCYRGSRLASLAVAATLFRNDASHVYRRCVSKFITLTNFAAHRLIAAGIPEALVTVKPNFVADLSSEHAQASGHNSFVFAGRLSPEKGVQFLLDSWETVGDVPLTIVGDGPLRDDLERLVRRMLLPVTFRGPLNRADLSAVFREARAVIVPSMWFEGGVPLTILESMTVGTPVIASRIGGIPELIDHETDGLLFDPGDRDGLIAAVQRINSDDGLRRHMGLSGREKVRLHHDPEVNLRALIAVYESAMGA